MQYDFTGNLRDKIKMIRSNIYNKISERNDEIHKNINKKVKIKTEVMNHYNSNYYRVLDINEGFDKEIAIYYSYHFHNL